MGKKLVIAEKPMLAKAILDAIPGTAKSIKAGERVFYTEKGDYLVVALAGHVLQLKEPEDYDPKYKKWTLEDLPIFFPDWAAVPAQGKGNIVKCVKSLLPQADSVIHAGDVDDEGQLIVDELLRYCGYRGKVQRLYTSDTSTAALKKRLGMLEDNAKWEPLGVSAYARSVTDKTFGINFSRLYTKLNGTLLTVGRVQTPAMGLVVARDEAIENHVARKYYALEVQAEIDGRQPYIPAEFIPTKGNPLLGEEDTHARYCCLSHRRRAFYSTPSLRPLFFLSSRLSASGTTTCSVQKRRMREALQSAPRALTARRNGWIRRRQSRYMRSAR